MFTLYNSLTRQKEEFRPINPPNVGMYTCGPTVYDYISVGNLRTFVLSDLVRRVLTLNGYKVKAVLNITDVGHLTGDNLGNADIGEDRLEKAAARENKTAWDIAEFYTEAFLSDIKKLNIQLPDVMPKATEHIEEQIELIKKLEEKGLTYKTSDAIYFDTQKYEKNGGEYGKLSTMDQIKAGARVEENPEKKDPRDFALWKFSEKPGERQMEWDSPWGLGFPGWHIECSAMSMKYLGETFDIHVGGEDLRQTHHPNEIAQSEAITGKTFVNYWLHGTHLLVDGRRMGRSLGNVYRLSNVIERGYKPIALRYLYLTSHYRDPLNFTWEALEGANNTIMRLVSQVKNLKADIDSLDITAKSERTKKFRDEFKETLNDDLNTPKGLAVVWDMLKSNLSEIDKYNLLTEFDEVLGLGVEDWPVIEEVQVGESIITNTPLSGPTISRLELRNKARTAGDFGVADRIREEIESKENIVIKDDLRGTIVEKKSS